MKSKDSYVEYWKNFLAKERQPLFCEVSRLSMIAEYYFMENNKYCEKGDGYWCDTLYEFVTCDKRPYGNKNIPASIAFNLGWGFIENEYMTEDAEAEALKIHNEVIEELKKREENSIKGKF